MKIRLLLPATFALATAMLLPAPAMRAATSNLDYGDMSSSTLDNKGWGALNSKDFAAAIGYTTKCIDTYKEKALEQQKSLTQGHPTALKGVWALNDVAVAHFIRAKAYEGLLKVPDAIADYSAIVSDFHSAECTDGGGNKWKPADPAKTQLALLGAATKEVDTISKVDLNTITVKTPTTLATYRITMQTQILYKGQIAHLTDLHPGLRVEITPAANAQEAATIAIDDPAAK